MRRQIKVPLQHESISLLSGIAYARVISWFDASMRDLKMDILMPKHRDGHAPCPAFLWFCGGAFKEMDRAVWIPQLIDLARRGYVVVSADYRTSNEKPFPAPLEDAKAAVRFLKAHAAEFCIDPERIAVSGESAGGTIACLVGVTAGCGEFDVGENLQCSSSVRAVVDFYGLTDMKLPVADSGEDAAVPFWCMDAFLENRHREGCRASAVNYVTEDTPPFLILHGDADCVVPIQHSEELYERLTAKHCDAEFDVVEGAGHGDDLFYQEPVLNLVDEFLKRVM